MDSAELRERLRVAEVPPAELRVILSAHFRSARNAQGSNTVDYMKGDEVALSVEYAAGGVDSVRPGPCLHERDLAAIERAVGVASLTDHGQSVWREVVFAKAPVTGSWRYRDRFQIVAAPEHAPRPPVPGGGHPFVLEVAYASSPDSGITVARARARFIEVNLLLAAFVPLIEALPRHRAEQQWAIPVDHSASLPRSIWTQPMYSFGEFPTVADDFTPSGPKIALVEHDKYYEDPGIGVDRTLELPRSLEEMFNQHRALEAAAGARVLRWAYWLNHARLVWSLSRSAHYLALIQSIEAVRPNHSNGAGTGFVEFVNTFVPPHAGESERERQELYRLRSELVHGQELMVTDLGSPADFHPESMRDRESAARAERLARMAGINWLRPAGK